MPVLLTEEIKKEIADQLESGMKCCYNIKSGELVYFPDGDKHAGFEEEFWEEDMKKVDDNPDDYIYFEGFESHESFRIMEDFIDEIIPDEKTQERFKEILLRRKPFQQFKELLFDYPDLRQQWFAYKDNSNIKNVEEQLEVYNMRGNL